VKQAIIADHGHKLLEHQDKQDSGQNRQGKVVHLEDEVQLHRA